jgi:hypothetical protein
MIASIKGMPVFPSFQTEINLSSFYHFIFELLVPELKKTLFLYL